MVENVPDSNPYAPPSQETPASKQRSRQSLSTFEVLSISWAFTGLFPAVLMMLMTRSLFGGFFAYVVTVVLNVPVLFSVILLLTMIRIFQKNPIPNMLLSAVCGAVSAAFVVLVINHQFDGLLTGMTLGSPLIVLFLSIGGAVSNCMFVHWYENWSQKNDDPAK